MELEKIKAIIAEVLNIDADSITEDTTFVDDLGADSLDIFQIIMGIEEEYDIELDNESVEQIQTVGDAVSYTHLDVYKRQATAVMFPLASTVGWIWVIKINLLLEAVPIG